MAVDIEKFGTMKPPKSEPKPKANVEGDDAQDILDSIKDGDVESLRLALKHFVRECYASTKAEDEEDDDTEEE